MKLTPETTQKIFIVWFGLLTLIACFNFYHNLTDASAYRKVMEDYKQNTSRYEQSMKEHEEFRNDHKNVIQEIQYIKGRLDGQLK